MTIDDVIEEVFGRFLTETLDRLTIDANRDHETKHAIIDLNRYFAKVADKVAKETPEYKCVLDGLQDLGIEDDGVYEKIDEELCHGVKRWINHSEYRFGIWHLNTHAFALDVAIEPTRPKGQTAFEHAVRDLKTAKFIVVLDDHTKDDKAFVYVPNKHDQLLLVLRATRDQLVIEFGFVPILARQSSWSVQHERSTVTIDNKEDFEYLNGALSIIHQYI